MNVLASYWFTLGKLNERNFGTTWSVWRLKRHVKSGSTVLSFFYSFIFLQLHYPIYQLSYFCVNSVLKLLKFNSTVNLVKQALAWRADDSPRSRCHQRKSRKKEAWVGDEKLALRLSCVTSAKSEIARPEFILIDLTELS